MNNELYHFGIIGMKWGIRRYQKADGTLTKEGAIRYNSNYKDRKKLAKFYQKEINTRDQKRAKYKWMTDYDPRVLNDLSLREFTDDDAKKYAEDTRKILSQMSHLHLNVKSKTTKYKIKSGYEDNEIAREGLDPVYGTKYRVRARKTDRDVYKE